LPIFWEQSYSDKITLVWDPLPFRLKYQPYRDERNVTGIHGGLSYGKGFSVSNQFFWNFGLFYKRLLNDDNAFVLGLDYNRPVRTAEEGDVDYDENEIYGTGFKFGMMFQLDDNKAITPALTIVRMKDYSRHSLTCAQKAAGTSTRTIVPIGFDFHWSISKRWNFSMEYSYYDIGYDNDYFGHKLYYVLSRYW